MNRYKRWLSHIPLAVGLAVLISSCSTSQESGGNGGGGSAGAMHAMTLPEAAEKVSDLSTFVKALEAADLMKTLEGSGPFTVFAPSNAAFDRLPAGKLQSLMQPQNKEELRKILLYHVVSGQLNGREVVSVRSLKSLEGQYLRIRVRNGKVYVDGALLEEPDINASNGVIHRINEVLLPR